MQTALVPTSALDLSAIDRADLQPSTRAKYKRELEALDLAGVNPADHVALQRYADSLKSSRKAFLKSGLRLITKGIEQELKANANPANLNETTANLYRLEAMQNAVNVPQPHGQKAHTWLSQAQVKELTALCNGESLEQQRDYIILGLLVGAGLRREELSELTFDALKQQPTKSGKMRDVLEIKKGKGNKSRVIPISEKLGQRLRAWRDIVGGGRVTRSLGRKMELGESMSAVAIFELVRKYGARIGIPELAPHDLRRSYAQIGYNSGVPITQISTLLGHSSLNTTKVYLSLDIDLTTTASDFIPLS